MNINDIDPFDEGDYYDEDLEDFYNEDYDPKDLQKEAEDFEFVLKKLIKDTKNIYNKDSVILLKKKEGDLK